MPGRRRAKIAFGLVAALAIGWRLVGLTDWPSPFYRTLQYESALAARAISIDLFGSDNSNARRWREEVGSEFFVAPPVLPFLTATANRATGEEAPWASRLFTISFWLMTGLAIARQIHRSTGSDWAAVAGFAWFSLCPFGLIMSRSFQTESLLVLAFAIGVVVIAKPRSGTTWRRTLFAGATCGLLSLAKPGMLFAPLSIGFAFAILPRSVAAGAGRKFLHWALFTLLLIVPGAVYSLWFLRPHAGRIMPQLLGEAWYYAGVWFSLRECLGIGILVLASLGVAIAVRAGRYWMLGLVLGHFATLGVFTYHAATHDYYQVPLMVVAALAIGELGAWLERNCHRLGAAALALAMVASVVVPLEATIGPLRWLPENREELRQRAKVRDEVARRAKAIGERLGVHDRAIELTEVYGYPLRFHGWVQTARWPSIEERDYMQLAGIITGEFAAEAHLRRLMAVANCRYFVVTDFAEWNRQPDLKAALVRLGKPIEIVDGVLVFELDPNGATAE